MLTPGTVLSARYEGRTVSALLLTVQPDRDYPYEVWVFDPDVFIAYLPRDAVVASHGALSTRLPRAALNREGREQLRKLAAST